MLLSPMNPAVPGPSSMPHLDHVCASATLPLESGLFPPSPLHMPPSKRPKLSLQTSQLPTTYASSASTTSNSVVGLSTTTPTTLNTFSNTFDLAIRPSPNSATTSPASFHLRTKPAASPLRRSQPYSLNLPLGVRSILKNSRLAKDYRGSSLSASASPRTGRRVFFPPAKKVSFQTIDEEIVTQTYTARHIDLSSSEDEQTAPGSEKDEPPEQDIAVASTEETSEVDCPQSIVTTPLQDRYQSPELVSRGRRRRQRSISGLRLVKKKRRWEWTIGETVTDDVADKETLTPLSPLLLQLSPGRHPNADAVDRGIVENLQPPEAPAREQEEDVTAAVASGPNPPAHTPTASTESDGVDEAATQKISLETTTSNSDELPPLPSSPQPGRSSIVKAIVKLFQQGT